MINEDIAISYVKKWLGVGYNTDSIDKDKCIEIGNRLYRNEGLDEPKHYFVKSIHQLGVLLDKLKKENENLTKDEMDNMVELVVKKEGERASSFEDIFCGQYSAYMVGPIEMYLDGYDVECNGESDDFFRSQVEIAQCSAGILTYNDYIVWADRTLSISNISRTDSEEFLHNPTGPAIEWRCGLKAYYYDNRRVDQDWIEHPENITVDQINECQNMEDKRILIALYGEEKFLSECELVDISEHGELYAPRGNSLVKYLHVVNGSEDMSGQKKRYILQVWAENVTAKQANASTWGLDEDEYSPDCVL